MSRRNRPYIYYDATVSLCTQCLRKVDAKVVFQDDNVYLLKRCPEHGRERVLISDDVAYYRRCREQTLKPPEMPRRYGTSVEYGCPYDCGLCPDHEQHGCLVLVEVTDRCNLECPVCYAESGPARQTSRSLADIERMLDAVVESEGEPDVVQISGGEPTIHPEFFEILDAAKARPIKHLMVNTNGVRIARDPAFAARLATYMPGLEIYLQFDSLEEGPLRDLRGADLRDVREAAIARLNEHGISTTLVVTLKKGLNDGEVGTIIEHALKQPAVRGVTFQPVQAAGRLEGFDPARDRLTLSEVRRLIVEQSSLFSEADVVPVPCHPDGVAMAYALKVDDQVLPLTGLVPAELLLDGASNTISFERDDALRSAMINAFSTNHSPASGAEALKELLCCLPRVAIGDGLGYENVFRVVIMQFLDAHSFDVRAVRKACVQIVHPDGRLIPFDTYNLFYRDALEQEVLEPIRAELRLKAGDPVA